LVWSEPFYRRLGPHSHEYGSFDGTMRRMQTSAAGVAVEVEKLEASGHDMILCTIAMHDRQP
jgi:hypothetical protein